MLSHRLLSCPGLRSATTIKWCRDSSMMHTAQQLTARHFSASCIDFDVASKIRGDADNQKLTVRLLPGQSLTTAKNAVTIRPKGFETKRAWLSNGIEHWTYTGSNSSASLTLGTPFANQNTLCKIERVKLDEYDNEILSEYGCILCTSNTVNVEKKKMMKLQQCSGSGDVFLGGNNLQRIDLQDGDSVSLRGGEFVACSGSTKAEFDRLNRHLPGALSWFLDRDMMGEFRGPGTIWRQDDVSREEKEMWGFLFECLRRFPFYYDP